MSKYKIKKKCTKKIYDRDSNQPTLQKDFFFFAACAGGASGWKCQWYLLALLQINILTSCEGSQSGSTEQSRHWGAEISQRSPREAIRCFLAGETPASSPLLHVLSAQWQAGVVGEPRHRRGCPCIPAVATPWTGGRCHNFIICNILTFFLSFSLPHSVPGSSPAKPAWPQTPAAAVGSRGWGLRRVAPPSQQPELPASPSPSPSWCRRPPEWRCGKCLPDCENEMDR